MKDIIKIPKTLLYSLIGRAAEDYPDKPAVYNTSGEYVVYSEIIKTYQNFEPFLKKIQVKPYERIAIVTKDEIVATMISINVYDRAVLLPVDIELPEDRTEYLYKLLDADYIITDDLTCVQCRIAKKLGMGIIFFTSSENRKDLKFRVESARKKESTTGKEQKSHYVKISTTSGTTSTPKIVPKTASEYNAGLMEITNYYDYSSSDNFLVLTRIFKGYTISTVFRALAVGGTVVLAGGFNHGELYGLLKTYKITVFTTVPAVMSSFIKYAESNDIDFSDLSLRFIQSAGATLSKKLKEYFESVFRTQIVNSYGMTEVGVISTTYNAPNGYKEDSVGPPFLMKVKIADDEILVKGSTVFSGYENADVNNEDYFTDGWFHTGDTGYIDDDGYIYITGRIKEMINRGGEKVSPYEIENEILKLTNITDAAVFPYPNSYGSENVGAVIVLDKGSSLDIKELRKLLTGKLPPFKMPKILFIVDEIPKSISNKIQRKQLYSQLSGKYQASNLDGVEKKNLILTETEKGITKIWKNTLRIKNPGINDTFTELGGDSMDGAVVLSEIEKRFKVRLPVEMLFENGSIKSVSNHIDSGKLTQDRLKFLVPIKLSGSKKPLICVHSGTGDAVTYRHLGKYMDMDRPVYALRFDRRKIDWPKPLEFKDLSKIYAEEIRQLNPEGPYFLCGHCWGGVLTFSIASELANGGSTVDLLAMLDSPPKKRQAGERSADPGDYIHMGRAVRKSFKSLMKLPFKKMISFFIRKVSNIGNMIKLKYAGKLYNYGVAKNLDILIRLAGKTGMLTSAYDRYTPSPYKGKIVYFQTTGNSSNTPRFPEYWKNMAAQFECVQINCKHNDIVVGDDAKILVKKLEELMRTVDA